MRLEPLIGRAGITFYSDGMSGFGWQAFQFPRHDRQHKTSNLKFIDIELG